MVCYRTRTYQIAHKPVKDPWKPRCSCLAGAPCDCYDPHLLLPRFQTRDRRSRTLPWRKKWIMFRMNKGSFHLIPFFIRCGEPIHQYLGKLMLLWSSCHNEFGPILYHMRWNKRLINLVIDQIFLKSRLHDSGPVYSINAIPVGLIFDYFLWGWVGIGCLPPSKISPNWARKVLKTVLETSQKIMGGIKYTQNVKKCHLLG